MKRLALLASALLFVHGLGWGQDARLDGRLKAIKDKGSVAIAYRSDAEPFSFLGNTQQPIGYSIDLCRRVVGAIGQQLGVPQLKIDWVPVNSDSRFDAVAKGRADLECGSSSVTLERMKSVDFSSFIFVDGTGLLVKTASNFNGLPDLGNRRIGVIAGTSNEAALKRALVSRVVVANVVPVKSREEGLAGVESGELDAFASDRVLLIGLAGKARDARALTLLADALSFEPYAIVLPRGDWQLRLAVNSALAQIYRSGAVVEIYNAWFGKLGRPGVVSEMVYVFGALSD